MGNGSIWPFIIIIGILVIAYFFPTQLTGSIKWSGDGIKSIIGGLFDQKCPDTQQVVCDRSTGVSYQNGCYAQKAKVNYTLGPCEQQ